MIKPPCKFDGCDRTSRTRQYCEGHYRQLKRGAELKPLRQTSDDIDCIGPDCVRVAYSQSLCRAHYTQKYRGKPLAPLKFVRVEDTICSFPDCGRPVKTSKLCAGHATQLRLGKRLTPINRNFVEKTCSYIDCQNVAKAKDLCGAHWLQQSQGKPLVSLIGQRLDKSFTWTDRAFYAIYRTVDVTDSCHVWNGSTTRGYGTLEFETKRWLAHRLAYCASRSDPEACGEESVHHKCANSACVNPEHLELATRRDNNAEMFERKAYKKTIEVQQTRILELETLLKLNNIDFQGALCYML